MTNEPAMERDTEALRQRMVLAATEVSRSWRAAHHLHLMTPENAAEYVATMVLAALREVLERGVR